MATKPSPTATSSSSLSLRNKRNQHTCAVTLIAPDVVLSAAHCAETILTGSTVVMGQPDFLVNNDDMEAIAIENMLLHPDYE